MSQFGGSVVRENKMTLTEHVLFLGHVKSCNTGTFRTRVILAPSRIDLINIIARL